MLDVILKRFEQPDELRQFENGKFELVHIACMTIGRATYSPGWKWSEHVGRSIGKRVVMWSMWVSFSPGERLLPWTMAE
jgi:hypothetical protein